MEIVALYLLVGAMAGTLAGLLGVGGGLIVVPALAMIFQWQGMPEDILMQLAVGTSLATVLMTSISSMYAHHRHRAIQWPLFWQLIPGIAVGALLGASVAESLPSRVLQLCYGLFALVVAAQIVTAVSPPVRQGLPSPILRHSITTTIGAVSSIVGIGGGTMTVPLLLWCSVPMRQAIATSAACAVPLALVATLAFIYWGAHKQGLPGQSLGYVYGPALAAVGVTSILCAPLGAHLAHRLPRAALTKIFAMTLFSIGVWMLLH